MSSSHTSLTAAPSAGSRAFRRWSSATHARTPSAIGNIFAQRVVSSSHQRRASRFLPRVLILTCIFSSDRPRFKIAEAILVLAEHGRVQADLAFRIAARGESLASHRDGRGAPPARRDDREPGPPPRVVCAVGWQYREYLSEEQRSRPGCIARRMQPDFHHRLISPAEGPPYPLKATPSSAHPRY